MSIGFTHLRSFHAVATTGGFTRAAQMLKIGQPTVTTQIKELESSYGVELFLRQGRQIALTEAGQALTELTGRIMQLREEAHELLSGHGKLQTGHLRVAAVGPFHATAMIAAFRQRHPGIEISIAFGNSEQTLARLTGLEADVAVLAHPVEDPRVLSHLYSTHEVVVFVNADHPWFGRTSVPLEELEGQPCVLRERGSSTRLAFERAMAGAGLSIRQELEIGSREGVWKAVELGMGIGVVADFEFVAHPRLCPIAIAGGAVRTEYRIAVLRDRAATPKLRAFLEAAETTRAG
ncbi:LysR family transcriptional regulator [Rhodobacteraceae bacterium 2376]|uniref:LysR family transcriptional regulator n=1 Tax=Rhabdonatronobacter sediminivivens TaxID=2743469 RepID=A0A7Z0I1V5_9RHOB|nr:LysR substrate-binding domain-containing protein [Rhabdonatronobacter sediminivivens]NYS26427.1 LysR family transcriptional regulator [Rhabdonatronobacter sediminivivens]